MSKGKFSIGLTCTYIGAILFFIMVIQDIRFKVTGKQAVAVAGEEAAKQD